MEIGNNFYLAHHSWAHVPKVVRLTKPSLVFLDTLAE